MFPLTLFVHGEAGVGKSTLLDTMPAPRLILDAEGRSKFATGRIIYWDPYNESPPVADGTWDTCVAVVPDFDTLTRVYEWLASAQHPFVSAGVDSLMEIQKRYIDKLVGPKQLQYDDWGALLRHLEKLVRDFNDLANQPINPLTVITFTCGSKPNPKTGKMGPLLQGGLRDTVPYFPDILGYMYSEFNPETGQYVRNLLVQPSQVAEAKDGTRRLATPVIPNPDISQILASLNGGGAAAPTS